MKLLYTDIRTSLTEILTKEAQGLVDQGKRVFYIVQQDNFKNGQQVK